MKKILLLGGSFGQVPAILEAKKRNLHTILCDYLPDNPGKELADEFFLVSTTDKEAVLKVARQNHVDFVMAYASDPAALTAAYVAEAMNLPGNSTNSVQILTDKLLFRKFLAGNGFYVPVFEVYDDHTLHAASKTRVPFPLVVKPVDSSDTKGVYLVHKRSGLKNAIAVAMEYSRSKTVILEEYIDAAGANLHGDGFVKEGQLVFCLLGDYLYTSESHPLKPSATRYPGSLDDTTMGVVTGEISRAILLSGFRDGPVNIEARINSEGKLYIMEVGPRSGGSLTPQIIYHSSGFDMLGASFDSLLGIPLAVPKREAEPVLGFTVHTNQNGIFDGISLDPALTPFLVEKHIYVKPGDPIKSYLHAGSSLGVYIFRFDNEHQLHNLIEDDLYKKLVNSVLLN